jgi:hypothetical protein
MQRQLIFIHANDSQPFDILPLRYQPAIDT